MKMFSKKNFTLGELLDSVKECDPNAIVLHSWYDANVSKNYLEAGELKKFSIISNFYLTQDGILTSNWVCNYKRVQESCLLSKLTKSNVVEQEGALLIKLNYTSIVCDKDYVILCDN